MTSYYEVLEVFVLFQALFVVAGLNLCFVHFL